MTEWVFCQNEFPHNNIIMIIMLLKKLRLLATARWHGPTYMLSHYHSQVKAKEIISNTPIAAVCCSLGSGCMTT